MPLGEQPNRSRPILLKDLNNDGLNDLIVGTENVPALAKTFPPESSQIYINTTEAAGKLQFKSYDIPTSDKDVSRSLAIGKFDQQLYLFSANECQNTDTTCFSKVYKIKF